MKEYYWSVTFVTLDKLEATDELPFYSGEPTENFLRPVKFSSTTRYYDLVEYNKEKRTAIYEEIPYEIFYSPKY